MNKELLIKAGAVIVAMILITTTMVAVLKRGEARHEMEQEAIAEAEANSENASVASKPEVSAAAEPTEGIEMPATKNWPYEDDPTTTFDESKLRPIPGSDNLTPMEDVEMHGVMCWGDSLTAGYMARPEASYPSLLGSWLTSDGYNCNVVNMGATGEDSRAIAARAGGVGVYNHDDITLISDGTPSEIILVDDTGTIINTQLHDSVGINPCTITDESGHSIELELKNTDVYTGYANYTIRPYSVNPEIFMPAHTPIKLQGATLNRDYLPVIFSGNNGGFKDLNEYITQIDGIINDKDYNNLYIVVGITMPGVVDFDEYDKVME
ncbi:MAG: hypothetical protein HUJ70_07595, partial [Pseudobutyrivibrio sp.]|nr:hypothetical protein [Pseudobutyrivibrio sp.]